MNKLTLILLILIGAPFYRKLRAQFGFHRWVVAGALLNLVGCFLVTPSFATTETVLHSFSGSDGGSPAGNLVQGADGNFYGTTAGSVFKITPSGTLTTSHFFNGDLPRAGLVLGKDGNFYGTTERGGANNSGTIFRITTGGLLTTLYSFTDGSDGAFPIDPLVQGSDGNPSQRRQLLWCNRVRWRQLPWHGIQDFPHRRPFNVVHVRGWAE